jgi:hypothetical protein
MGHNFVESFTGCRTRRVRGVHCSHPIHWVGNEVYSHAATKRSGRPNGQLRPVTREGDYDPHSD